MERERALEVEVIYDGQTDIWYESTYISNWKDKSFRVNNFSMGQTKNEKRQEEKNNASFHIHDILSKQLHYYIEFY